MTFAEFEKIPMRWSGHIALADKHMNTYDSVCGRFSVVFITPQVGRSRKIFRIGKEWFKSKKKFINALSKLNDYENSEVAVTGNAVVGR